MEEKLSITALNILETMLRIRIFEQELAEITPNKEFNCPVHLYVGQEAIASSVCENLTDQDYVFSTHRSHGHYIAKGGNLNRLMAEIFCRETGCSGGHGGSMHITDKSVGFIASSAIVAGTIPVAVGAALTAKRADNSQISVAFFGDGATDEGVFWESINIAALYELPILFVCENNLFSTHLPVSKRQANQDIGEKVSTFGYKVIKADGNDALEVYSKAKTAIEGIRRTHKPAFLEAMTFRWLAHVGPTEDLDIGYRRKKDVEYWRGRCPIKLINNQLIDTNKKNKDRIQEIEKKIKVEVADSIEFARTSALPSADRISHGLYN